MFGGKTAYHYSKSKVTKLENYEQKESVKPIGLWYAYNDDWKNFVTKVLDPKNKKSLLKHKYIIEVNKTDIEHPDKSKVLFIDNAEDLEEFTDKYSIKDSTNISWDSVAKDYAGIEIGNYSVLKEYVQDHRVSELLWIGTLDMDSGCVWNPDAVVRFEFDSSK